MGYLEAPLMYYSILKKFYNWKLMRSIKRAGGFDVSIRFDPFIDQPSEPHGLYELKFVARDRLRDKIASDKPISMNSYKQYGYLVDYQEVYPCVIIKSISLSRQKKDSEDFKELKDDFMLDVFKWNLPYTYNTDYFYSLLNADLLKESISIDKKIIPFKDKHQILSYTFLVPSKKDKFIILSFHIYLYYEKIVFEFFQLFDNHNDLLTRKEYTITEDVFYAEKGILSVLEGYPDVIKNMFKSEYLEMIASYQKNPTDESLHDIRSLIDMIAE